MVGRFYGCALDSEGRSREVNVPFENRYGVMVDRFYGCELDSMGSSREVNAPLENRLV